MEKAMNAHCDAVSEAKSLFRLSFPIVVTALIFYSRSIVSMLFLGRLGKAELAGGSLGMAIGNITGFSILSGLALGMEPLCTQAYGAKRLKLLSLTLHRCVIFLLLCSVGISLLWLNVSKILRHLRQEDSIARVAQTFLLFSLPDLVTNSFVHPIRIYLRAQGITYPLTMASLAGAAVHFPVNFVFVTRLRLGVAGVAAASSASNLFILAALVFYVWGTGVHVPTWAPPSLACLTGWKPMIRLAAPSCVSVCLEWWWYEIMTVLCGLLPDPESTLASMGVLIQTTSLLYIFPSSLSYAVSTRVGNELGASRPDLAKLSSFISISTAVLMGFSALAFASLMKHTWARIFTSEPEVIGLTAGVLPILGFCEIGNCPQTAACGVVRGTARPGKAAVVNIGAFYLVGLPAAFWLAFFRGYGFYGLWAGLLSAQASCAALMLYVVAATDWPSQAERARNLTMPDEEQPLLPGSS